jgi:hypothetical protein
MGFVRDRSIVDNAKLHVGSKYVYNIDLKDFFPSVDQARVWKCLQLKPLNLKNTEDQIDLNEVLKKIYDINIFDKYNFAAKIRVRKYLKSNILILI